MRAWSTILRNSILDCGDRLAVGANPDLDLASNSHEIPNVPADEALHSVDDGLVQPWVDRVYLKNIPRSGPVTSSGSRS